MQISFSVARIKSDAPTPRWCFTYLKLKFPIKSGALWFWSHHECGSLLVLETLRGMLLKSYGISRRYVLAVTAPAARGPPLITNFKIIFGYTSDVTHRAFKILFSAKEPSKIILKTPSTDDKIFCLFQLNAMAESEARVCRELIPRLSR